MASHSGSATPAGVRPPSCYPSSSSESASESSSFKNMPSSHKAVGDDVGWDEGAGEVGIDDVDIVVPDLVKRLAPIFQSKLAQIHQEFASFESKSSDLVHGGGGGEPQPDVCAAQSIDDTGALVSFRARKDTYNHQYEPFAQSTHTFSSFSLLFRHCPSLQTVSQRPGDAGGIAGEGVG